MKTLERFWMDGQIKKRVTDLRTKLPPFFSRFSDAELVLSWGKFSEEYGTTEWASLTKKAVNEFVAQLDISEEDLAGENDEGHFEEEEEEDDAYLDRDKDLDFERDRDEDWPFDDDYEDKEY
jgi:hypothetical protein